MTTIQTARSKVDRDDASPAARWTPAGRWLAAGTLVLASALQLGSHLVSPTLPTADQLVAWAAANPEMANLMKVLDIAVLPVLFGTVLVYVLLSRQRSPRLAYAGGALLGLGLVGLSAWEGAEAMALTLAQDGRADLTVVANTLDETSPPAVVMQLMLVVGGLLGVLTLAAALWRSAAVPRIAAALTAAPLLVDVFVTEGLALGPQWVPHLIALVPSAWIAVVILTSGTAEPRPHAGAR